VRSLTRREAAIVAGCAVLAVVLPLYLWVFLPRLTALRVVTRQVQMHTRELAYLEQAAVRLPGAKHAHDQAEEKLRAIQEQIPRDKIPELIVLLGHAIDASGVQLVEITFPSGQTPQPFSLGGATNASLTEVPLTLRIRGTFKALVAFMRNVEALPRLVTIQTLGISDVASPASRPGGAPTLGITIDLQAVGLR
jgi:Tfp pilus assembly protein PilO